MSRWGELPDIEEHRVVEAPDDRQAGLLLDARRLAEALRAVDIVEKRPVDSYVGLATEIAVAYGPVSVPDVLAGVPQREPADVYSGQGAVTDTGPSPEGEPKNG